MKQNLNKIISGLLVLTILLSLAPQMVEARAVGVLTADFNRQNIGKDWKKAKDPRLFPGKEPDSGYEIKPFDVFHPLIPYDANAFTDKSGYTLPGFATEDHFLKSNNIGPTNVTYESVSGKRYRVYDMNFVGINKRRQIMDYSVNGFCMDPTKEVNTGDTFNTKNMHSLSNRGDKTPNIATAFGANADDHFASIKPFLDFYYYATHIVAKNGMKRALFYEKIDGDETDQDRVLKNWSPQKQIAIQQLVQGIVWLHATNADFLAIHNKLFPNNPAQADNMEVRKKVYAEEMRRTIEAINKTIKNKNEKIKNGTAEYDFAECLHSIEFIQEFFASGESKWSNNEDNKIDYHIFLNDKERNKAIAKSIAYDTSRSHQRILAASAQTGEENASNIPFQFSFTKENRKGQPLTGATFEIQYVKYKNPPADKTEVIVKETLNGNGPTFTYNGDIKGGTKFTLREITPPTNYKKLTKEYSSPAIFPRNASVEVHLNTIKKNTIVNDAAKTTTPPANGAALIKRDAHTGEALDGAIIRLVSLTTGTSKDITVPATGKVLQSHDPANTDTYIPEGEYSAEEISAPIGYDVTPTGPRIKNIRFEVLRNPAGDPIGTTVSGPLVFENAKKKSILIRKVDLNENPLDGGTFSVYRNGTFLRDVTVVNGEATLTDVQPGTYTFYEKTAPAGYELPIQTIANSPILHVTQDDGEEIYEIKVYNNKLKTIVLKKVDRDNQNPLPNAEFKLYKNGKLFGTYTTDGGGEIRIPNMTSGFYEFEEITAPAGYLLPHHDSIRHAITIEENDPKEEYEVIAENYKLPAVKIQKVTNDGDALVNLPGAEFEIKINNTTFGTFTTNDEGAIEIDTAEFGNFLLNNNLHNHNSWEFTATELTPPPGYLPAEPRAQTITVTKGQALAEMVFINSKYPEIVIEKLNSDDDTPVAGAVYEILIDAQSIPGIHRTDDDGLIRINYKNYQAFLGEKRNQPNTSWTVTIKEIVPPAKFFLTGNQTPQVQTAELRLGATLARFTFKNQPLPDLKVWKINTKNNTALQGVTFQLTGVDNQRKITATTGPDGMALFTDIPDGTYKVKEIATPTGYVISQKEYTIVSKPTVAGKKEIFELSYGNAETPKLTIQKIDDLTKKPLAGVKFNISVKPDAINGNTLQNAGYEQNLGEFITDQNGQIVFTEMHDLAPGLYTITEIAPPDGYTFHKTDGQTTTVYLKQNESRVHTIRNTPLGGIQIIKKDADTKEALAGATFEIRDNKDTLIGVYTTDSNGVVTIPNLDSNVYYIKEIKAPDRYEVDETVHRAEVKTREAKSIVITNKKTPNLQIKKIDETNKEPIPGVVFEVRTASGTLILKGETDSRGLLSVPVKKGETYTVKELKAKEDYFLNPEPKIVSITKDGTTPLLITNKKKSGFTLLKIDATTKLPLQHAEFLLLNNKKETLGTYTTDSKGEIHASDLKPGTYYVKEIKAPDGYTLDTNEKVFTIKDGQTTHITIENKAVLAQIVVQKLSKGDSTLTNVKEDEPLRGAVFNIIQKKSGKLISQIITGADGKGFSKPIPLGAYEIEEIKAPKFYAKDKTKRTVVLEYENQVLETTVYNKPAKLGVNVKKKGPKEVVCGSPITYTIYDVKNESNTALDNFFISDLLPHDAITANYIMTGTYNHDKNFDVVVEMTSGERKIIAGNLNTKRNNKVLIPNGLSVKTIHLIFGTVEKGFYMETPMVVHGKLKNGIQIKSFENTAKAGGTFENEWFIKESKAKTNIWCKENKLPRTGH